MIWRVRIFATLWVVWFFANALRLAGCISSTWWMVLTAPVWVSGIVAILQQVILALTRGTFCRLLAWHKRHHAERARRELLEHMEENLRRTLLENVLRDRRPPHQ